MLPISKALFPASLDFPSQFGYNVFNNRQGTYKGKVYDLIFGPVANDTIYRVFSAYEEGIISKAECIRQLKVRKLYNQITFATDLALSYLNYSGLVELKVREDEK